MGPSAATVSWVQQLRLVLFVVPQEIASGHTVARTAAASAGGNHQDLLPVRTFACNGRVTTTTAAGPFAIPTVPLATARKSAGGDTMHIHHHRFRFPPPATAATPRPVLSGVAAVLLRVLLVPTTFFQRPVNPGTATFEGEE
jgi:hypothetical protein